jgi:hypothetical protein
MALRVLVAHTPERARCVFTRPRSEADIFQSLKTDLRQPDLKPDISNLR